MADMPPDETTFEAEQYRLLEAKRIIVACERLDFDPRATTPQQAEQVKREIATNRDAIDATVAQRWPQTFEGLD